MVLLLLLLLMLLLRLRLRLRLRLLLLLQLRGRGRLLHPCRPRTWVRPWGRLRGGRGCEGGLRLRSPSRDSGPLCSNDGLCTHDPPISDR